MTRTLISDPRQKIVEFTDTVKASNIDSKKKMNEIVGDRNKITSAWYDRYSID